MYKNISKNLANASQAVALSGDKFCLRVTCKLSTEWKEKLYIGTEPESHADKLFVQIHSSDCSNEKTSPGSNVSS